MINNLAQLKWLRNKAQSDTPRSNEEALLQWFIAGDIKQTIDYMHLVKELC